VVAPADIAAAKKPAVAFAQNTCALKNLPQSPDDIYVGRLKSCSRHVWILVASTCGHSIKTQPQSHAKSTYMLLLALSVANEHYGGLVDTRSTPDSDLTLSLGPGAREQSAWALIVSSRIQQMEHPLPASSLSLSRVRQTSSILFPAISSLSESHTEQKNGTPSPCHIKS
jgi:hypothetical protein